MLMEWKDLEAGDVLRYRDEVYEHFKDTMPGWCRQWCNKNLTINFVEVYEKHIVLGFSFGKVYIDFDGTTTDGFFSHSEPIFEIVSLKE